MIDLHHAFGIFHERITPNRNKKMVLGIARNVIRGCIRTYFHEILKVQVPEFKSQGDWTMDTMVNPIVGEYAIKDGVFLQHLDKQNRSTWPSALTIHQWISDATSTFRDAMPENYPTYVRVRCRGQYHVDLPCYSILNGRCLLATQEEKQWPFNDPVGLSHWFQCHLYLRGEQLKRVVRYLKAWADFQSKPSCPMPSSLILTVFATNYYQSHPRDDIAFAQTLQAIATANRNLLFILNPIDLSHELTECLTDKQKRRFQKAIHATAVDAEKAVRTYDQRVAYQLWQKHLGQRFPFEGELATMVAERNPKFAAPHAMAPIGAFGLTSLPLRDAIDTIYIK